MANVLKVMGVRKGDVVTIYLPRIPEIFFAMLACAKIGAVHSVFSPTVENVIVVRNTTVSYTHLTLPTTPYV